jgi:hypothetical protein
MPMPTPIPAPVAPPVPIMPPAAPIIGPALPPSQTFPIAPQSSVPGPATSFQRYSVFRQPAAQQPRPNSIFFRPLSK